jgi:NAD(P)-dependent dehydrogenase (short-subunit alcohol dehydrogenase family)
LNVKKSSTIIIDRHPGRSTQAIGLARAIGTDPDLIHEPSIVFLATDRASFVQGAVLPVDGGKTAV